MKVSDALTGIQRLAFDTAPLIYFIERHPKYFPLMAHIMNQVANNLIVGSSASIALTEVLVQPLRNGNQGLANRDEQVLSNSHNFRLHPISVQVARRAADFRANYNLRTPDALHIAVACSSVWN